MFALSLSSFLTFLQSTIFMAGYINSNNLFPEPLSMEEELEYIKKYEDGDEDARNILIERNLRLVAHISKKYSSTNVLQDDLISIGTIGLIKGINSYKSDKGFRLATYIAKCIDNEILMYLRTNKKTQTEVYLNDPVGKDKEDNEISLIDILENDDKSIEEQIDLKIKIKKLYKKMKEILVDRERAIIEMRYGLDGKKPKTQHQIAKIFGISRSYVSRIETKAINKLSKEMQD